jgi:magnesium transporter
VAIEKVLALAVLMPIVASMGGNAGTRTLTIAVRALVVKELTAANALRIIGKETLVGGMNGILLAIVIGAVATLWFGEPIIGVIIGATMVINLLLAGVAGTGIPVATGPMGCRPCYRFECRLNDDHERGWLFSLPWIC